MLLRRIRIKLEMTVLLIYYVIKLCSVKVKINLVARNLKPVKMILIVLVY